MREAISRLNAYLAELIRLAHRDRFSLAHAAELLGVPASTARGAIRGQGNSRGSAGTGNC